MEVDVEEDLEDDEEEEESEEENEEQEEPTGEEEEGSREVDQEKANKGAAGRSDNPARKSKKTRRTPKVTFDKSLPGTHSVSTVEQDKGGTLYHWLTKAGKIGHSHLFTCLCGLSLKSSFMYIVLSVVLHCSVYANCLLLIFSVLLS